MPPDRRRPRVYVPDPAADAVTTLDARTGAIVRTVRLAARPADPILDAAAGRVFVPYQSLSGYAVLDAWSGRLVRASAPGRGLALAAAALDEGRQRAFVADDAGGTVATDDLRTGRTLRTVGVGIHPSKLAFDRPRDRVLVTDAGPCCAHGQPTGNGALVVSTARAGARCGPSPWAVVPCNHLSTRQPGACWWSTPGVAWRRTPIRGGGSPVPSGNGCQCSRARVGVPWRVAS